MLNEEQLSLLIKNAVNEAVAEAMAQVKNAPARTYTSQEVCDILHVTLPTLWSYVKDGKLSAEKIGRRVFFNADVIDDAVNKGTVGRRGI